MDDSDDSHTRHPGWRGPIRDTVRAKPVIGESGAHGAGPRPPELVTAQPEPEEAPPAPELGPPLDFGTCWKCKEQMEGVTVHARYCRKRSR